MRHYSDRVPSGTEQQYSPPLGTHPANPETLGNSQARGNSSTSPTRSSDSDTSDMSDKSKKSRKSCGDDRLREIPGTLTLQNIGMSDSEMFSGDVSKFHRFLNRYEGLMKNVADPQVKLNYLLMWTKEKAHEAISHCDIVFQGNYERAFEEAIKTLKFRFGTASKIANKTAAEIIEGKVIKSNSEDDLWSLISELRICDAALRGKEGRR
jgi:hypothetical protein